MGVEKELNKKKGSYFVIVFLFFCPRYIAPMEDDGRRINCTITIALLTLTAFDSECRVRVMWMLGYEV